MCYALGMKRKMRQRAKVNKGMRKGKRSSLMPVFFVTLCVVLAIGTAGILILRVLTQETKSEEVFSARTEEQGKNSFVEEEVKQTVEETAAAPVSRYSQELADEEYMRSNRIYSWEASHEDVVTLGFVGDFLMDDEYAIMANLLRRGGTIENGISEALLGIMQGVDILTVNNEFPFTNRGMPTPDKTFTFRADTDTVSYLHDMGVDVAVLANNHIYDFGEEGLLDTLDTLSGAGIAMVGAGRNLEEASAPVYFIVNDIKIAVVAATQIERLENPDTKGAGENSAGVFRCLNPDRLCETVAKAKENSDFVVVYIHWGTENQEEIDWAQLDQAPKIAKAGADLIIGDHPHCLQEITYFDETPVIYSMGNFWFNSRTIDTGMVQVTLDQEGLKSFQFVPAIQSDSRVDLAYGEDKERILNHMRTLSPNVNIDNEGFVRKN